VWHCERVTAAGVAALAGADMVSTDCPLTDREVSALAGARLVYLANCQHITDAGVRALAGAQAVVLLRCHHLTHSSLRTLGGDAHLLCLDNGQSVSRGPRAAPACSQEGLAALSEHADVGFCGCTRCSAAMARIRFSVDRVHRVFRRVFCRPG